MREMKRRCVQSRRAGRVHSRPKNIHQTNTHRRFRDASAQLLQKHCCHIRQALNIAEDCRVLVRRQVTLQGLGEVLSSRGVSE